MNNDLVPSSIADSRLPELEHIIEIAALSHPSIILNPMPLAWWIKDCFSLGRPSLLSFDFKLLFLRLIAWIHYSPASRINFETPKLYAHTPGYVQMILASTFALKVLKYRIVVEISVFALSRPFLFKSTRLIFHFTSGPQRSLLWLIIDLMT
ncbi:hypothetical protein B0H13DRAFT_2355167 [Mycena leptocephala]|nr:hypothetical protein B0H13DRAFT_2355167 [Mycena leptocephala]